MLGGRRTLDVLSLCRPISAQLKARAGRDNPMHLIASHSAMTSITTKRATRSVARNGRRLSHAQDGARCFALPIAHDVVGAVDDVVALAASARTGERGSRPPSPRHNRMS